MSYSPLVKSKLFIFLIAYFFFNEFDSVYDPEIEYPLNSLLGELLDRNTINLSPEQSKYDYFSDNYGVSLYLLSI